MNVVFKQKVFFRPFQNFIYFKIQKISFPAGTAGSAIPLLDHPLNASLQQAFVRLQQQVLKGLNLPNCVTQYDRINWRSNGAPIVRHNYLTSTSKEGLKTALAIQMPLRSSIGRAVVQT